MDEQPKKDNGLGDWMNTDTGRAKELAAYAGEVVREFPEVTLRAANLFYHLKDGHVEPGVALELTGPESAVRAFLASLALARNVDSVQIFQGIDPETGRTSNKPVKDFTARMKPWKP